MSQESTKILLDKINLLFNVFMKDGLEKISSLEKDLLKEQIQKLLEALDQLNEDGISTESSPYLVEVESIAEIPIIGEELEVDRPHIIEAETKIDLVIEETSKPDKQDLRVFSTNKPSRSLKEIIDLNKSFILKAELFDNKHEDYSVFIADLNSLETEEASVKLVESKAKELSWDIEDKPYDLLLRAVEKRFLPLLQQ
jgi:hypothetical protein